jgi:hypothetical protein
MGLRPSASVSVALARQQSVLLLIDTYERLSSLDTWLRDTFLPQLPRKSLVVLAGRHIPDPAWSTDPGWHDLVRLVGLRNLSPADSRAFLDARGIAGAHHTAVLDFTHGHPLALALVADLVTRGSLDSFRPEQTPDVVRVLVESFVREVPSADHRRALEVCARARVTTQALLAEVIGPSEAPSLFAWLRSLSFIEQGPEGLFPHDLARDVLDADLRWRDSQGYRDLHGRVLRAVVHQLQIRTGREQQRAYFDLVYLSRNSPLMRAYYDWDAMSSIYAEPATTQESPAILAMVRRHEGEAAAGIAEYWLNRQPGAFRAFRHAGGQLFGFTAILLLDEAHPADCAADPAVAAAWRFVGIRGPLRPGERMMYHRFWIDREAYQSQRAVSLAAAAGAPQWLSTPGLAWTFIAVADPGARESHFEAIGFPRAQQADFMIDGQRFGVFSHDWRIEPAAPWIERKGQLDPATDSARKSSDVQPLPEPLLVLSRTDFTIAVRQALRDLHRPDVLAGNLLLRTRVTVEYAGNAPTPATLQALLRAAAAPLLATPREAKLYFAIQYTYFEPAATQELAAERLGLPFSTYRSHLTAGVAQMTEWLWQRELRGHGAIT